MALKKKVTLKNIADDCGISISSVSMILNRRTDITFSTETIDKVFASARKLGYEGRDTKSHPNTAPSNPRKIVAIFCPNIYNSYYSTIAQAIEQAAYLKGYRTTVITTFRDPRLEQELIQSVIKMNLSGIIFTMMPNNPGYVEKIAKRFPIVAIGDKASTIDLDVIETSNYTAGMLMAEHLYELGHRHIAFLTTTINPDLSLAMRYQRLRAIQSTFQKLAMNETYEIVVKEKKISPELERKNIYIEHNVGYDLCNQCLEDRKLSAITAFIGNNDMVSYGIMDAILKKGYKIPRDFSVCGFDNDFASGLLPISLTTVEHYMEDKGKKAFEMLYQRIQEKQRTHLENEKFITRIEYKSKLIVRDSTNIARTSFK